MTPPEIDVLPTPEESARRFATFAREMVTRLPSGSLAAWWRDRVAAGPNQILLRTDDDTQTYRAVDERARRVAEAAYAGGVRAGDTVAIQLPTSAAFLVLVLGLAHLGVRLSLLSPGLRGQSLRHALVEVPPVLLFTTPSAEAALRELDDFAPPTHIVLDADTEQLEAPSDAGLAALEAWIDRVAPTLPSAPAWENDGLAQNPDDTLFYIFTSGTTGLPKATQCSHRRYLAGAASECVLFGIDQTGCMLVFLPMFHIAALSSIGAALATNASIVLRPRFSASKFWQDVDRFSATHFQYLGEIVRYLLAQPSRETDRPNTLEGMVGAGLNERNWRAFEDRFGPVRIVESYGSSEGVVGIFNLDGVQGSVGRAPAPTEERIRLARYDVGQDRLVRTADGRLVLAEPGEPGELIARLDDRSQFEGYSSDEATRAKLLEDAFEDGDLWYRSGDLFRKQDGYYYFVSRLGDTYRWKGENVSAQQVANALLADSQVEQAAVYPVVVPDHEGSAGMALVSLAGAGANSESTALDGRGLCATLLSELPSHALPLFLRIGDGADSLTETYKLGLAALKREGYASDRVDDPLFVLDAKAEAYVPLTSDSLTRLGLPDFDRDGATG